MAPRGALFPVPLPPWVTCILVGIFVIAIVSIVVTRSLQISAPPRRSQLVLEEELANLRTGDVVLQAGVSLVGLAQRFILNTPISHVGVLYVERQGTPDAFAWVLEATRDPGVHVQPLWTWLADTDSRTFYRRLAAPLITPAEAARTMRAFIRRHVGRPYSYHFWIEAARILPLALPMPFDEESKDHARFCSELVAEAWMDMGALNATDQRSHTVMPRDLFEEPPVHENKSPRKLMWTPGAGLEDVHSLITHKSAYEVRKLIQTSSAPF